MHEHNNSFQKISNIKEAKESTEWFRPPEEIQANMQLNKEIHISKN